MRTRPVAAKRPQERWLRPEVPGGLDYSNWTFEELRALAIQLRVRDAGQMTRDDLVEMLGGPRPPRSASSSRPHA